MEEKRAVQAPKVCACGKMARTTAPHDRVELGLQGLDQSSLPANSCSSEQPPQFRPSRAARLQMQVVQRRPLQLAAREEGANSAFHCGANLQSQAKHPTCHESQHEFVIHKTKPPTNFSCTTIVDSYPICSCHSLVAHFWSLSYS